ncbi:MAG: hypothetical protein JSW52_08195 [Candidatus Coatesbacteria bacterium]|nr:MAG: hypothetical protein JSW52_08195 [Candidatus Coatesbacteria bacterium]
MTEDRSPVRKTNATTEMPPEPEWLFYVLSFFVQIAGIVIGAIYMGKPNEECRRFGKNCLIAAIIPILLYCLCIYIYILFAVAYFVFYVVLMIGVIAFAGLSGGEYAFIGALAGIA